MSDATDTRTDYIIKTRDGAVIGWSLGTNGFWTALTRCQSRDFKTERGARRWWMRKAGSGDVAKMQAMLGA